MSEQLAMIGAAAEAIEVPPSEIGPTVRRILKTATTWHSGAGPAGGSGTWSFPRSPRRPIAKRTGVALGDRSDP